MNYYLLFAIRTILALTIILGLTSCHHKKVIVSSSGEPMVTPKCIEGEHLRLGYDEDTHKPILECVPPWEDEPPFHYPACPADLAAQQDVGDCTNII